jgi:DNA-binding response OmpR family regulator
MSAGGKDGVVVSCPRCRRNYRLPRNKPIPPGASLRCTACGHVFPLAEPAKAPPAPEGPRVLVASDGGEVGGIVKDVLREGGYAPRLVREGEEAWRLIQEWQPRATILDVGLPGIPVFEICDRVRQDPRHSGLAIILLASVYEQTRYKRSPTSLYGADDYIEKHHLRDSLVDKVARHIAGRSAKGASPSPPVREEEERAGRRIPTPEEAQKDEQVLVREEKFGSTGPVADPNHEKLKRFARIIVSDIALYNQEALDEGIRKGNLAALLKMRSGRGAASTGPACRRRQGWKKTIFARPSTISSRGRRPAT